MAENEPREGTEGRPEGSGLRYPEGSGGRQLTEREKEWIGWILPGDRKGYRNFREMMEPLAVIGEGRRGKGELIMGREGVEVDFSRPLAPVFAYGAIETDKGLISVTLREMADEQISLEIVAQQQEELPATFEERRRWTYSLWSPGSPCPQCSGGVREVTLHAISPSGEQQDRLFVLAICPADRRLWVHEEESKVNRLVPVTNFYNELMLHKNIREPKIALDAKLLFRDLTTYSDEDLRSAFVSYNGLRKKVEFGGTVVAEKKVGGGLTGLLRKMFSR